MQICDSRKTTSKIEIFCKECGKSFFTYKSNNRKFCSLRCAYQYSKKNHKAPHLTEYNLIHNSKRMTELTKQKLSESKLDKGAKDCYRKVRGRHEHRVVMERHLGRKLSSTEIVHHIDKNKRNNSLENLMLFKSQKDHLEWHRLHDPEYTKGGGK